ncbi:MAG: peptide-methionine (S)-S-oxide reductase MsrA [Aquisalinus sp.]|nr:peptide-methionine (S)-S-oxide reductase MsrA [Aquisalinus sp.]
MTAMKRALFLVTSGSTVALSGCIGISDGQETTEDFSTDGLNSAVFAGGCFWCVDKHFEKVDGVTEAITGYVGGTGTHQKHEQWKSAGYREVAQVWYDPTVVSYRQLADYHLKHIDPLNADGQFCDSGNSYLGAIYFTGEGEQTDAQAAIDAASEELGAEVVTLLEPAQTFYPAVAHHQDYYKKYSLKYNFTVSRCGREERLREVWGDAYSGE